VLGGGSKLFKEKDSTPAPADNVKGRPPILILPYSFRCNYTYYSLSRSGHRGYRLLRESMISRRRKTVKIKYLNVSIYQFKIPFKPPPFLNALTIGLHLNFLTISSFIFSMGIF